MRRDPWRRGAGQTGRAKRSAFPLLIKARARRRRARHPAVVDGWKSVERAFLAASAEAQSRFRRRRGATWKSCCVPVKHIEMQVLCDAHGAMSSAWASANAPCSAKTRKLMEESPFPAVDERNCAKSYDARRPCAAAKAVGYEGVGTMEFLLHRRTRILFHGDEHPPAGGASRHRDGHGLRSGQVADPRGGGRGAALFTRRTSLLRGHAIECRINAENPAEGFRPSLRQSHAAARARRARGCALIPRSIRTTSSRRIMIP